VNVVVRFVAPPAAEKFVRPVVYPERSMEEEMEVLYSFLTRGVDAEDIAYLKQSYETMLTNDMDSYWLNDTHWVDHPDILSCYISMNKLTFLCQVFIVTEYVAKACSKTINRW